MESTRVKCFSKIIIFIVILSMFFALFHVAFPPKDYATTNEGLYYGLRKIWIFYLFLPISIGSILFGLKYNQKGYKVKKNIVIGVIFSILMFCFGTMHFIGLNAYSTDYKYVKETAAKINFDLPNEGRVITMNWTNGKQTSYDYTYYKFESVVRFDIQSQIDDFETRISNSINWNGSFNQSMQEIVPLTFALQTQNYNYFMLFSFEKNEYNTISKNGNEQNFIYIAYDSNAKVLIINEFAKKY